MKEKWTGDVIALMHCNDIRMADVAQELNVTKAYLSMILNGKRNPPEAKERIFSAVDTLIRRNYGG